MKSDGFTYPVAKMNVKYIKPATFEDILVIKSDLISIEPSLDIQYVIFNKETGEKIFEATTMQIGINAGTGESVYTAPLGLIESVKRINDEKI